MERRTLLRMALAPMAAGSLAGAAHAERHDGRTAFVLVHGSWHGGWCWGLVEPLLQAAGHLTVALDLPGHGLNARNPAAFGTRPLDRAAFAEEISPLAGIPTADYALAVQNAAARARALGAGRIVAVAHSMGGVPATFAAADRPDLFDAIVYLAALAPVPGKPAGAYLASEDQAGNSVMDALLMADPAVIGAVRIDPRSEDPGYLASFREALAADVPEGLLAQVMHMLTPDAPAAMYGKAPEFAEGFGALRRSYIRCSRDRVVVASTPEAVVADLNAAFPDNPAALLDLDASHEAMFGAPEALADMIMSTL